MLQFIHKIAAVSLLTSTILIVPSERATAISSDGDIIIKIVQDLAKFLQEPEVKPTVTFNSTNPCRFTASITGIRGVYGNAVFPNTTYKGTFWQMTLGITHREGFVQNDVLEMSGNVVHLSDYCDDRKNDPGDALSFLINMDLNIPNVLNSRNSQNQINLRDPNIPYSRTHALGGAATQDHFDILEEVSINANVFENDPLFARKQWEIGRYNIEIIASHSSTPVPESSTLLSSIIVATTGFLLKIRSSK